MCNIIIEKMVPFLRDCKLYHSSLFQFFSFFFATNGTSLLLSQQRGSWLWLLDTFQAYVTMMLHANLKCWVWWKYIEKVSAITDVCVVWSTHLVINVSDLFYRLASRCVLFLLFTCQIVNFDFDLLQSLKLIFAKTKSLLAIYLDNIQTRML